MITVTAATGHLGRLVVEDLLQRGVPADQIVAAVRNPAKAAELADRGVQVREADYTRPETLAAAFAGTDRLLLISSSEVGRRLPAAYIGAMGSRRTHDDRDRRLRETGLTDAELTRLHSPIDLDLGARTPEETALSIAAEIIATRHGGTGLPLRESHTSIHHDTEASRSGSASLVGSF
jgi:hypothetical protein